MTQGCKALRALTFCLLWLVASTTGKAQVFGDVVSVLDTMGTLTGPNTLFSYQPGYTYDYIPDLTYNEIQDRLTCVSSDIPLTINTTVKAFIDYFTVTNRDYTRQVMAMAPVYFPLFEQKLKEHNMPDALKYLAIVESGLNPTARSRAGAGGLWQFMPLTGRDFGLYQNFYIDNRFDPEKSTEAACKYLKRLYAMFNDWELAMAAYNCGPGNVRKAIRRSGYKKSFWEIYKYLPRETRSYVPQFIAITYTLNNAESHNLFVDPHFYTETDTVTVNGFMNLDLLAQQLDLRLADLKTINPEVKHFALPKETRNYPLRLPQHAKKKLLANRQVILDSAAGTGQKTLEKLARNTVGSTYGRTKLAYRVRPGDVLGTIAQRHKVRVSDIRKWNNLRGNLIRVGQRLTIYVRGGSAAGLAPATTAQRVPGSGIHIVRPGDSLWKISRKYEGLTIAKLRAINNLQTDELKPGQRLRVK